MVEGPVLGIFVLLHVFGTGVRLEELVGGLGERWEILANTYKPYPCGVVLNPVIEACLDLAHDGSIVHRCAGR